MYIEIVFFKMFVKAYIFKILFLKTYLLCMCVLIYRYVYGMYVCETHRGNKRVSSPLEMEFHTAVYHVGIGN